MLPYYCAIVVFVVFILLLSCVQNKIESMEIDICFFNFYIYVKKTDTCITKL